MAALDNVHSLNVTRTLGGADVDWERVKPIVAGVIWRYYRDHENDALYTIKQRWFGIPISYTLRVCDCRLLIEKLVGPEPQANGL